MAALLRGMLTEAPILSVCGKFYLSALVRVNTKTVLPEVHPFFQRDFQKAFDSFLLFRKDLFFLDKEDNNL